MLSIIFLNYPEWGIESYLVQLHGLPCELFEKSHEILWLYIRRKLLLPQSPPLAGLSNKKKRGLRVGQEFPFHNCLSLSFRQSPVRGLLVDGTWQNTPSKDLCACCHHTLFRLLDNFAKWTCKHWQAKGSFQKLNFRVKEF